MLLKAASKQSLDTDLCLREEKSENAFVFDQLLVLVVTFPKEANIQSKLESFANRAPFNVFVSRRPMRGLITIDNRRVGRSGTLGGLGLLFRSDILMIDLLEGLNGMMALTANK